MSASSGNQILYVDDEKHSLKFFRQLYQDRFEIATAESADEGLRYIQANSDRIAVLVTDQRMPGKTGVELMEVVRSRFPNIVRVLVTAYTHLEYAVKAVNEGGAFRYLTKPWNDDEMIGTLLRATEYHQAMEQRDSLLREKLSVLHRLIVMDRVRGLATTAAALDGRLRGTWPALLDYLGHAPVKERIRLQLDSLAGMNMSAVARREAEAMVKTIGVILSDTAAVSTGDRSMDLAALVRGVCGRVTSELSTDDLHLNFQVPDRSVMAETDAGMFERLLLIMLRRLSDLQEQPAEITVTLTDAGDHTVLESKGNFGRLGAEQVASLFSAAIPLRTWPLGLDMDLLAAFMIARHLGGRLLVNADGADGPTLAAELPKVMPPSMSSYEPAMLDAVYDSLSVWEESDETY